MTGTLAVRAAQGVDLPDPRTGQAPFEITVVGHVNGRISYDTLRAGSRGLRSLSVHGTIAGGLHIEDQGERDSNAPQSVIIEGYFDRGINITLRGECALGGVRVRIQSGAGLGTLVSAWRQSNGDQVYTDVLLDTETIEVVVGERIQEAAEVKAV